MAAKNMKELEAILKKRAKKGMEIISKKALADMYEETGNFYMGKEPTMYERTGALGDTPRVTSLTVLNNEISFNAYLDKNHKYMTGKNPTMEDILNLTKATPVHGSSVGYLRSVRGRIGFWERAKDKMKIDFNETMGKFFEKV